MPLFGWMQRRLEDDENDDDAEREGKKHDNNNNSHARVPFSLFLPKPKRKSMNRKKKQISINIIPQPDCHRRWVFLRLSSCWLTKRWGSSVEKQMLASLLSFFPLLSLSRSAHHRSLNIMFFIFPQRDFLQIIFYSISRRGKLPRKNRSKRNGGKEEGEGRWTCVF